MSGGRFATLDSLRGKGGDDDEKEDGQNTYYAGGAGRQGGSGLSVVGPPGPPDGSNAGGHIEDIFNRATDLGSAERDPSLLSSGSADPGQGQVKAAITMYRNGFTVNDGPFRRLDDPDNAEFLGDLARGVVPRELHEQHKGLGKGPLLVNLVDRRSEDYEAPPVPSYVAYSGEGQTMGSSMVREGAVVDASSSDAMEMPTVNESEPTTTLQIRLSDGRRVRSRLNTSHTVRHIQAVINSEGAGGAPYVLMAGFPPVQITDFSQTLKDAGLIGAQIVQKPA